MKKTLLIICLSLISLIALAQQASTPRWTGITSNEPKSFEVQLLSSSESRIRVSIEVPGFYATEVKTPRGMAQVITVPKSVTTAQAGEPHLPMVGIPVLIGDRARMQVKVVDAQYVDYPMDVAPSKGDISRQVDPATVPFTYGDCYKHDRFFPDNNVSLYEPYIIRDFRGQNIAVQPFAYNPIAKTLRVYHHLTVEMYKVDERGNNVIESRRDNTVRLDPDFKSLYQRHFINYEAATTRYTPVDETGDLLIICHGNFMNAMTDFVNWKKTRGVRTTIVNASTAGSSYSAIKTYIQNQYNANNNLTHVLLVGDVAQIPGYTYTGGGYSYSGKGDNPYGQVVGNDIYNDLFIGRFSASSVAQVTTQVQRVITYERDLTTAASWCQKGLGVSASEGGGGHYNEDDYQHIENIRTDLLNYGYSTVYQDYKSVSGYPNSTTTTISNHINSGVGIINYCNHGEETAWQSHYYYNSHVNALTNSNQLPFIFSVACLNGKYDYSGGDCFAEAWMHATHNSSGAPTGAVGTLMSYISQPWIPPMWAQDEFVDILIESYNNNIKHTWGGAAINGIMAIFDHYNTTTAQALGTYQAWILYGDPTLMLRTKTPQSMSVNHAGSIMANVNTYTVTVSNGNGALATITDANHNIMGSATVSGGTATIHLTGTLTPGTELTLCVFGYNKVTYLGTITVNNPVVQYTISASAVPAAGGTVTGAGTYEAQSTCTLTATPNAHYTFTNWKKGNTVVSTNPTYSFKVTANATFTANFTAEPKYTITCASVNHGSISASKTSAYQNETITLSATPDAGYEFLAWDVRGANNASIAVGSNNTFTMPASNVTVSATFKKTVTGHFVYDNTVYSDEMTVMAVLQILETEIPTDIFEIGAFCDDDCRGSGFQTFYPSLNRYYVPLDIYGDEGDVFTFKLFNTASQTESNLICETELLFNDDGYGSLENPLFLNFIPQPPTTFTQTFTAQPGWCWWSTYIEMEGTDGMATLQQQLGSSASLIKSQNSFTSYNGTTWNGTLNAINNESCYLILFEEEASFELTGTLRDTPNHPITINGGWNWIGYPCSRSMTLEEAFSGYTPEEGDMVKSQSGFSTYTNGQWEGSLQTLEPGNGYLFLSQSEVPKMLALPE